MSSEPLDYLRHIQVEAEFLLSASSTTGSLGSFLPEGTACAHA